MEYVESPQRTNGLLPRPYIFLAGGIPGCPDWQAEMSGQLRKRINIGTIFNPRRSVFFENTDVKAKEEQITWEFQNLWRADIIAFWFSRPTENPTTLFEYGTHMARRHCSGKRAPCSVVGIDPGYAKERGVRMQTRLFDPEIRIAGSLEELALMTEHEAVSWVETN